MYMYIHVHVYICTLYCFTIVSNILYICKVFNAYWCLSFCKPGDGFLKTFFEKTKSMNPEDRGKFLEEDEVTAVM